MSYQGQQNSPTKNRKPPPVYYILRGDHKELLFPSFCFAVPFVAIPIFFCFPFVIRWVRGLFIGVHRLCIVPLLFPLFYSLDCFFPYGEGIRLDLGFGCEFRGVVLNGIRLFFLFEGGLRCFVVFFSLEFVNWKFNLF